MPAGGGKIPGRSSVPASAVPIRRRLRCEAPCTNRSKADADCPSASVLRCDPGIAGIPVDQPSLVARNAQGAPDLEGGRGIASAQDDMGGVQLADCVDAVRVAKQVELFLEELQLYSVRPELFKVEQRQQIKGQA